MLWLRKSKKGFTLIELMVVVAIIGVLSLLGLRLYTGQQEKAKEAIVKANAGTVHTLIQAELADGAISGGTAADALDAIGEDAGALAGMQNPFNSSHAVVLIDSVSAVAGAVCVKMVTSGTEYDVQGYDATGTLFGDVLTAQR